MCRAGCICSWFYDELAFFDFFQRTSQRAYFANLRGDAFRRLELLVVALTIIILVPLRAVANYDLAPFLADVKSGEYIFPEDVEDFDEYIFMRIAYHYKAAFVSQCLTVLISVLVFLRFFRFCNLDPVFEFLY